MQSQSQSSYQEDILKVKKIWQDLQKVQKGDKRKQNLKIKEQKVKKTETRQRQNVQNKLHKAKSQVNLKQINKKCPQQVINFSTVSPGIDKQGKPIPSSTICMQSFNQRQIIEKKDEELSLLRISNQQLKDQIKRLDNKLRQKDLLIQKLKAKEHQLLGQTIKHKNLKVFSQQKTVQYINYKNDTSRLLKMLQTTKQFKQFAQLGIQDDGIRFLHQANRQKKSIIDAIDQRRANVHFCSCNGQFIQEQNLWVPQKAYDFSKQFMKQKRGQQLSQAELQLFLYDLNRIWRERQKKIINFADSSKALQVGKYRRKVQQIQRQLGNKLRYMK